MFDAFAEFDDEFLGNRYKDPDDFDVLRPSLLTYATESFTDGYLKEIAPAFYCDCDWLAIPAVNFDVRFEILESNDKSFLASGIQFASPLGDIGKPSTFV